MRVSSFCGLRRASSGIVFGLLAWATPALFMGACTPPERQYGETGGGGAGAGGTSSSSSVSSSSGGGDGGSTTSSSSSSSGNPINPGDVLNAQYFPSASTLLFSLAVDANGDSLLAGRFSGTLDFGDGALVDVGGGDIFLARHARDDKLLFSKSYGSVGNAGAVRGAVSAKGAMFITGDISDMTSMSFGGSNLQGPGVWQAAIGALGSPVIFDFMIPSGMGFLVPYAVAATSNEAALFTGFYGGSITFNGMTVTSAGDTDGYLIKFDPTGQIAWTRSIGGIGHENVSAVAVDPADNNYIAGYFTDTFMLGMGGGVTSLGGSDIFVAKYGPAGLPKWIRRIGGPGEEFIFGTLAVAPNGDVIVASRAVGELSVEATVLPPNGESDIFIVKYDTDGNFIWAGRYGDAGNQYIDSLAVDSAGNILLTGTFDGVLDFGSGGLMAPAGGAAYLAKLDPTGKPLFNRVIGGQMDAIRVAADGVTSILLAGTGTNVSFELGTSSLPNGGVFLVRIAP